MGTNVTTISWCLVQILEKIRCVLERLAPLPENENIA